MIGNIGKGITEELDLANPKEYTGNNCFSMNSYFTLNLWNFFISGHTFCQTSTRAAADEGATSTDLMRFFGWSTAKTANKYLDKSEPQLLKMSHLVAKSGSSEDVFDSDEDAFLSQVALEAESQCKQSPCKERPQIVMNNCTVHMNFQ